MIKNRATTQTRPVHPKKNMVLATPNFGLDSMSGVQYVVTRPDRALAKAPMLAVLARRMTVEHSARKTKPRGPADEA
jgi:hypothetical protein